MITKLLFHMKIRVVKKKDVLNHLNGQNQNEEKLLEKIILKNFESLGFTYEEVISKHNKKRYYFTNKNFKSIVKKEYSKNLKIGFIFILVLTIVAILMSYFEFAEALTGVVILFIPITVLGILSSIFFIPKKLILKNKYVYLTDFLGDKKTVFSFKDLLLVHSEKPFVYFSNPESLILISEGDNNEFIDFMNKYRDQSLNIKGNKLIV